MPHRVTLAIFAFVLYATLPLSAQISSVPASGTESQARPQINAVLGDALQQMNVTTDRLHRALSSVNIAKWKAPGDVRQTTQADVDSMLRDLTGTLPSLIDTAVANTSRVSPSFSVYRNVDALYDVLLRVAETAQLASAASDSRVLEDQRASLESSRSQLGSALLQCAQAQDAEVARLRAAAVSAPPAPAPTRTVIDDGPPAKSKTAKRTHKPSSAPATPQ